MSEDTVQRWSAEAGRVLKTAGWYPGRVVPTQGWEILLREHGGFRMHAAARRFLAEFGGLESNERGPGKTMARMGFTLDPTIAEWEDEIFDVLSEEAGAALYPIGAADRHNFHLGMTQAAAVYIGRDTVSLLGQGADEALEKLIGGMLSEPLPQ